MVLAIRSYDQFLVFRHALYGDPPPDLHVVGVRDVDPRIAVDSVERLYGNLRFGSFLDRFWIVLASFLTHVSALYDPTRALWYARRSVRAYRVLTGADCCSPSDAFSARSTSSGFKTVVNFVLLALACGWTLTDDSSGMAFMVRFLFLFSGPLNFRTLSSIIFGRLFHACISCMPPTPRELTRGVVHTPPSAHAHWMLTGACNPTVCPIHVFRWHSGTRRRCSR